MMDSWWEWTFFSSSLCAALYEMCTEDPTFGGEASGV